MSETPFTDPFPTRKSVFLLPFDMFISLEIQEIALTSQKFISEGNISLLKWQRSSELRIHETSKPIILLESYYFYLLSCFPLLFYPSFTQPSFSRMAVTVQCGLAPDADTGETLLIQKPFLLGAWGKNHKVLCLEEKNKKNLKTSSFAREAPLPGPGLLTASQGTRHHTLGAGSERQWSSDQGRPTTGPWQWLLLVSSCKKGGFPCQCAYQGLLALKRTYRFLFFIVKGLI